MLRLRLSRPSESRRSFCCCLRGDEDSTSDDLPLAFPGGLMVESFALNPPGTLCRVQDCAMSELSGPK